MRKCPNVFLRTPHLLSDFPPRREPNHSLEHYRYSDRGQLGASVPPDLPTWMSHKHRRLTQLQKGLSIFLGNLLPAQVSPISVNGIAVVHPISQAEDPGVLLGSFLLSCPTLSSPALRTVPPPHLTHVPSLPLMPPQATAWRMFIAP